MNTTETATCQDCGWTGPVDQTREFRNFWDPVLPGDVMPAGDCPEEGCGGAAMLDQDDANDDLRPSMVALMLGLDRLRESVPGGTLPAPPPARPPGLADYARRALAAGSLAQPVCDTCGGTSVQVDAWAAWHLDAQRWELHSTYEACAICTDCDGECSYTMKPVAG